MKKNCGLKGMHIHSWKELRIKAEKISYGHKYCDLDISASKEMAVEWKGRRGRALICCLHFLTSHLTLCSPGFGFPLRRLRGLHFIVQQVVFCLFFLLLILSHALC